MSQLAYQIRALISQRTALRDTVGVCDELTITQNKISSIKQHLQKATKESKPSLGNPAHPRLLLDECEQLIIPFTFTNHSAIAVVRFVVDENKRQAIIQYFDAIESDLSDEHLVPLVAFFTESGYEVEYQCVSEKLQKQGIDPSKLISYKAIDLVNHHAKLAENLTAKLLENEEIEVEVEEEQETPKAPIPVSIGKGYRWRLWILAAMLISIAAYAAWDCFQPNMPTYLYGLQAQATAWMALLPANPVLAITACAVFFCGAWLAVSGLSYLLRARTDEPTVTNVATNNLRAISTDETSPQKTLLHAYQQRSGVAADPVMGDWQIAKKKRSQP